MRAAYEGSIPFTRSPLASSMKNRWFVALAVGALLFAWTGCAAPSEGKRKGKGKSRKAKASEVDRDYVPRGGFR